jgi:hypothetical protein
MLTKEDKDTILLEFPNIKLSYENIIHKKVYNSDFILAIPEGRKCFAWFTNYNNKNICIMIELLNKKITVTNACFSSDLCYGTILYGTFFKHINNHFFTVEDIFYYKGKQIENMNWGNKLTIISELFKIHLKQITYNNSFVIFGLPLMSNNIDDMLNKLSTVKYKISTFQFRLYNRVNNYLFIEYKNFINNNNNNSINNSKYNNKQNLEKDKNIKFKDSYNAYRKETVFIVQPDIQNDIYHLYFLNDNLKEEYYKIAYIPDYKTSVMMNSLFRNIKENINLDSLEESDDEEEFENNREDKFVYLDKKYKMICNYNYKFKKWYPVKLVENDRKIILKRELLSLENK